MAEIVVVTWVAVFRNLFDFVTALRFIRITITLDVPLVYTKAAADGFATCRVGQ